MSSSINKVTLYGGVGADPDIKQLQNGKVASFSLATSTGGYKKQDGTEVPKKVEWHRVKVFGKLADVVEKYIRKGSKPIVEGRIEYGEFTKKDGTKGYTTDIIASDISLTGDKANTPQQSDKAPAPTAPPAQAFPPPVDANGAPEHDDLPF